MADDKYEDISIHEVVVVVDGGRVGGSCGAPYFNTSGKVVAFHFESWMNLVRVVRMSEAEAIILRAMVMFFADFQHFGNTIKIICKISRNKFSLLLNTLLLNTL